MIRQMRSGDNITGLKDLIEKLPSNITMAEVGTYAGESAKIFLDSGKIDKIYCIDLWHIEDWAEAEKEVDKIDDPRLVKLKMSSERAVNEFADESLDFCYIDANHYYEPCKLDITLYKPKVKKGGFIGGHDFKMESVRRAVDETIGYPDFVFKDSSWLKRI
jgi:predicted O-methyltransferase YrrM